MKKTIFLIIYIFSLTLIVPNIYAGGVGKVMQNFFKKSGGLSNYNKGGAYHDQASGYYTGGSFKGRVPIENKHFVNIQMPKLSAGCGGIDLYMGGFSFIKGEQLVQMGKAIVSNAVPYAAHLAIKTMSPEIASTMEKLEAVAQQINEFNMNSCQSAQTLLGGIWPKSEAASEEFCQRSGTSSGVFSDYVKARHECGTKGRALAINKSKAGEFLDNLGDEYNLAWEAIQKNTFLKKDRLKAELFMSLSGTIISKIREDEKSIQHEILPSLALNNTLIKALIEGGVSAEIYSCSDKSNKTKCLNIIKKEVSFSANDSVMYYVRSIVKSIETKAKGDGELEAHEIGFIEQTNLPILKYIELSILRGSNNSILSLDSGDYIELIAYDILLNYINTILDTVSEGIHHIRMVQLSDSDIKDLLNSIYKVKKHIKSEQTSLYAHAEAIIKFNDVGRLSEQQMLSIFYNYTKVR